MDYNSIKNTNSQNNLIIPNNRNKSDSTNPVYYYSYSDNDMSDKISNNNSDLEENNKLQDKKNLLKKKQQIKNSLIPTRDIIKTTKEKNINKNNVSNSIIRTNNKYHNNLNQNTFNNNFQNMEINTNNSNIYYENKLSNKTNDTYLNHYITRKNYSNNKNNKKFERIKNSKKRKDNNPQENKENKENKEGKDIKNKNRINHIKYKSLKFINDENSYEIIDEKIEHNRKNQNNNSNDNNGNTKLYFNKYIGEQNKNINYNYFILDSKNIKNIQKKNQDKKSSLNKNSIQNKSFNHNYNINKYKNYNSNKPPKNLKNNDVYICLRNSINNNRKELAYDEYFTNTQDCLDGRTLNPRYSFSHQLMEEIYNPININPPKMGNQNANKKFSKTFIDMKDIKINEYNQNENRKENNIEKSENLKIKNKIEEIKKTSNSMQKSYQKKLLNSNQNHLLKKNIYEVKKKDLTIKTNFDKNTHDYQITKQINPCSTTKNKAVSPLASQINNNLINTEKISKNKYDYLRNKIDFKKKISFNNSNNNTITNSKTITNQNNNVIIPIGQISLNKNIDLSEKNAIKKNNTKIMVYKKRRISNNKYQPKVIKENNKQEKIENNYTLIIKNFFTESKQIKEEFNNFQRKNIKKINLFKPSSSEKYKQHTKNKDNKKTKINYDKNDSISDNNRMNNYLRKNINVKKDKNSKIYMKSILKKWNMNAKSIYFPSREINSKVKNKYCFKNKFYFFGIQKYKLRMCFISKRYKFKIPINSLCVYSKNIILKNEKKIIKNNEEKNLNSNSIDKNNEDKINIREDIDNNINNNKNIEMLEDEEENENEDFKIEEYEENHINSIINISKNNNSINNSNSNLNFNNNINEEENENNITTNGKEIPTNSEACSLLNSKMSLNTNKKLQNLEKGLEKLCRIFFRNLEKHSQINIKNEAKKIKKEKSDSNINSKNQSKYSSIFSSTIQNWNDIDKKHYEKEDIPFDINNILYLQNKKLRKNKKHAKLLNINKAFSEEKIRDQGDILRRSANLKSNIKIEKNNNDIIIEKSNVINDKKEIQNLDNNNIIYNIKEKFIELLNILENKNYVNIFTKLLNLINNQNETINNKNSYEILLNNQFIFTEVLVDKAINEKTYMSLYAKLGKDLYLKLISNYININKKKFKGENLKSIIGAECRQKFDECDIITILNLEKNNLNNGENIFENLKQKLIGITNFICELINCKMLSQKMGLEYLDILHKRIMNFNEDIKNYQYKDNLTKYKFLYMEAELDLLEILSKIIIERKKPKHVQNLKNFIEDNIIPIVKNNKNTNSEDHISNYLICKIINFLDNLRQTKPFCNFKEIKNENKNNNKNIISIKKTNDNIDNNKIKKEKILNNNINNEDKNKEDIKNDIEVSKKKEQKLDEEIQNISLLKKEIEEYMLFLSEHNIEENKDFDNDINDEFNWGIVDDLIINKNIPLEKIVYYYVKVCIDIINDKSKIFKANEYIKNVINYYLYNFTNENVNNMHSKMIELFFDINNICINNSCMYEIMGFLLFLLLSNNYKLFYIKDLNTFLNKDINTQINIAKVIKYTIIFYGCNWKKYFNIFKKIVLFKDGNIFNNYIASPLKLKGFKI